MVRLLYGLAEGERLQFLRHQSLSGKERWTDDGPHPRRWCDVCERKALHGEFLPPGHPQEIRHLRATLVWQRHDFHLPTKDLRTSEWRSQDFARKVCREHGGAIWGEARTSEDTKAAMWTRDAGVWWHNVAECRAVEHVQIFGRMWHLLVSGEDWRILHHQRACVIDVSTNHRKPEEVGKACRLFEGDTWTTQFAAVSRSWPWTFNKEYDNKMAVGDLYWQWLVRGQRTSKINLSCDSHAEWGGHLGQLAWPEISVIELSGGRVKCTGQWSSRWHLLEEVSWIPSWGGGHSLLPSWQLRSASLMSQKRSGKTAAHCRKTPMDPGHGGARRPWSQSSGDGFQCCRFGHKTTTKSKGESPSALVPDLQWGWWKNRTGGAPQPWGESSKQEQDPEACKAAKPDSTSWRPWARGWRERWRWHDYTSKWKQRMDKHAHCDLVHGDWCADPFHL